jgi:O-antigen/teichoic acid export membrane protein
VPDVRRSVHRASRRYRLNSQNPLRVAPNPLPQQTWVTPKREASSLFGEGADHKAASRKFIRDVFFSNLPVPFQKLRTYLWLFVLTRTFGPAGFGAWALFIVTLSTATTFSTMNCGSSLMRFLSGERGRNEVNQAFSTVLAMVAGASVLLAVIFVLFSRQIASGIFDSVGASSLVILLGVALTFESAFEEMKNLLRARRLNQSWAYFCFARLLPETVAVIATALWFRRVETVALAYAAVSACCCGGGMLYLWMARDVRLVAPSLHVFLQYSRYGLALLPGVLASVVSLGADKYVVSAYLGLKEVGIYGACFTVSAVVFFLTGPINDVLFPELSALYDTGRSLMFQERFRSVQKFVFGFACGAAAILAAFPRQVLSIVGPPEFAAGKTTLILLGVQGIPMALVMLYVVILNTHLRVWSTSAFWVISGAAIILLDVILIPGMGIAGAALSQLIVTFLGALVLIALHRQFFRRTFSFSWLVKTGAAFAMVWIVASALGPAASVVAAGMQILAGAGVFTICLFVTGYLPVRELAAFAKGLA